MHTTPKQKSKSDASPPPNAGSFNGGLSANLANGEFASESSTSGDSSLQQPPPPASDSSAGQGSFMTMDF
jgi:hypothetical protein